MQVQTASTRRRSFSRFYWVVSIPVAAAALYWSARGINWADLWHTITSARPAYLWGVGGMMVLTLTLRAARWRILLNAEERLGFGTVFRANMVGYLGNNFLPARAGEVLRSVLIGQTSTLSKTYVLTTALSERMMDVIAVVLAASLSLLAVEPKPRWLEDLSRTMLAGSAVGVIAVAVLPHTGALVEKILRAIWLPEKVRGFLLATASQVLLGLKTFHDWGRLGGFAAMTVLIWSLEGVTVLIGGQALGLSIPYPVAMIMLTAMALGSALPSTPGYIGIYQLAAVMVLTPFGIPRDRALAYSVLSQGVSYIVVAAMGLPALYGSRRESRKYKAALARQEQG